MPLRIRPAKGLTLVELLVSISLSALAFTLIGGLYIFSNKLMINFQKRSFINDQRVLVESELRSRLRDMQLITAAEDKLIAGRSFRGEVMEIACTENGNIRLNQRQLLPEGISLVDFRIDYSGTGNRSHRKERLPDYNENFIIDGEELLKINGVEISFKLIYKDVEEESTLFISLRSKQSEVL